MSSKKILIIHFIALFIGVAAIIAFYYYQYSSLNQRTGGLGGYAIIPALLLGSTFLFVWIISLMIFLAKRKRMGGVEPRSNSQISPPKNSYGVIEAILIIISSITVAILLLPFNDIFVPHSILFLVASPLLIFSIAFVNIVLAIQIFRTRKIIGLPTVAIILSVLSIVMSLITQKNVRNFDDTFERERIESQERQIKNQ